MATLFSEHYGVWGPRGPKPGARVRISAARLRAEYLFNETCFAAIATSEAGAVVGHMLFTEFACGGGTGIWISQLVVHSAWRSRKIASMLVGIAIARPHALTACGMATSHPYAVRALEKAARRPCKPALVAPVALPFVEASRVPYIQGRGLRITDDPPASIINTGYFVDHSEVDAIRASIKTWHLGELADGEEFLALFVIAS